MEYQIVNCPDCERKIGRILVGIGEWVCRHCRRRVQAIRSASGGDVRYGKIDRTPRKAQN